MLRVLQNEPKRGKGLNFVTKMQNGHACWQWNNPEKKLEMMKLLKNLTCENF